MTESTPKAFYTDRRGAGCVREVHTDTRKARIFREAYGDVAAGLEKFAPWLTEYQLGGNCEFFTQGVVGL